MEKNVLLLVVCLSLYVRSAPAKSEMVWLTDVTRLRIVKRDTSDPCLPDNLTFQLRGGSRSLTLNLKRNHGIDPNADVYFVRKLNDGQPHLEKALNLENEDVSYYQDWQNGAFMTVRCVRRSNGECNRVINGNILIGDRNYDLQPAKIDITSEDLSDIPADLCSLYVLRDQNIVHREILVSDEGTVNEKNIEQEVERLPRRNPNRQKPFRIPNSMACSRNKPRLYTRDNRKQIYYVEIAVLLDSGIWDFHSLLTPTKQSPVHSVLVLFKLRQVFSHIINGVNFLYRGIKDPNIKIRVTLREFYIFQRMNDFDHIQSVVESVPGTDRIYVENYIRDLATWTSKNGNLSDHVILFTRYDLYGDDPDERFNGYSYIGSVCDNCFKTSITKTRDYMSTVLTAAHELGHNLGAVHDGEGEALACMADDYFLMSPKEHLFDESKPYSRNPWLFSKCSVESFNVHYLTTCLTNVGAFYNEHEWMTFTKALPGEEYSYNSQCEFAIGNGSRFCGSVNNRMCSFMQCTHPIQQTCFKLIRAAIGTLCGHNMNVISQVLMNNDERNAHFFRRVRCL